MKKEIRFFLFLGALSVSAAAQADTGVPMNLVDENGVGRRLAKSPSVKRDTASCSAPQSPVSHPGLHGFHVHENPSCEPKEKDGKKCLR